MSQLSCVVSEILSVIYQNLKRSRDPKHTPLGITHAVVHVINLHTNFEMHSFTHFKDMTVAQNLKKSP